MLYRIGGEEKDLHHDEKDRSYPQGEKKDDYDQLGSKTTLRKGRGGDIDFSKERELTP